jgi:hypothetical protein
LYHNTEILLKKYREVVWSIEASAIQAQVNFELEMNCRLNDFLEMSYTAGADLSGTQIEEQMRTMARNKNMLSIINFSVSMLRNRHAYGEEYYWILYYTYLSEKPCKTIEEIIELVMRETKEFLSWKTYYNRKRRAIENLSTILWGFASKDCQPLLEEFL